jgi:hypothetical protein
VGAQSDPGNRRARVQGPAKAGGGRREEVRSGA